MISSDLPEVLRLDRILVMREGRIAGEFSAEEATEERVVACATGVCYGLLVSNHYIFCSCLSNAAEREV